MKKCVALLIVLTCALSVLAKDDVTVEEGTLSELANKNARLFVTWDYTNSTIEGKNVKAFLKEKGEDWFNSYPGELKTAEERFFSRYNKKTKGTKAVLNKSEAQYKVVIKVRNFDYGHMSSDVASGIGAGDARLFATMEVYKVGSKEPAAIIDVDGVSGDGTGHVYRRVETYRELAEQFAKLIRKAAK